MARYVPPVITRATRDDARKARVKNKRQAALGARPPMRGHARGGDHAAGSAGTRANGEAGPIVRHQARCRSLEP